MAADATRVYEDRDVVEVNVGGTMFTTTAGTLRHAPFFESLLSGRFAVTCYPQHQIFIDRDAAPFACVLNVLRGSNDMSAVTTEIARELSFYGIDTAPVPVARVMEECDADRERRWRREYREEQRKVMLSKKWQDELDAEARRNHMLRGRY